MNSEEGQKAAEAELISSMNWVKHTELTLDRPVRDVWPLFKDMRRWYTEYAFESVSGPAYQAGTGLLEGQVLRVKSAVGYPRSPKSNETPAGPEYFTVQTIKVTPEKEIVAVLSGSAYDLKQLVQFYVWRMTETAAKTTVFVDAYGRAELFKSLSQTESSEYEDRLLKNWHRSWSEALLSLKIVLDKVR